MSNELTQLLNEIQSKTRLTLEEIAEKVGYSRPYLNQAKAKGDNPKLLGIVRETFKDVLQKDTAKNGTITVQTTPKDQLRDILQTKAMVKTLLHELAALRSKLTGESVPQVLEDLHQKNMNHLIDLANQKQQ